MLPVQILNMYHIYRSIFEQSRFIPPKIVNISKGTTICCAMNLMSVKLLYEISIKENVSQGL